MAAIHSSKETVEDVIADWPEKTTGQQQRPRETAKKLLDKYGRPDEITPERLVWHDNGPWKRTEVRRDGPKHDFPIPHVDHLAQTIDYQVPLDKYDDLARFDGSTYPDRTKGELTATCHKEEANVLALNLAHDVVTDDRTVDEAREAYAKINAKLMAGGSPDYATAFQFSIPEGDQRDPDVTIATEEAKKNAGKLVLVGLVLAAVAYYAMKRAGGRRDRSDQRDPDRSRSERPTSRR